MSTSIEIRGTYKQKTEIFGIVLSHQEGSFDLTKAVGAATWSQSYGPVTITESVQDGAATVTVSAFGLGQTLLKQGVAGHNAFKLELDHGNVAQGTVIVTTSPGGSDPGTAP